MGCYKECFDKRGAETVLNECKKEHRKEIRIYECQICLNEGNPCWHLTSKEEYTQVIQLKEEELIFKDKWKLLMRK